MGAPDYLEATLGTHATSSCGSIVFSMLILKLPFSSVSSSQKKKGNENHVYEVFMSHDWKCSLYLQSMSTPNFNEDWEV